MNTLLNTNINCHEDENDADKYKNAKKIGGENVKAEMPKRAAFGELQNRVLPRAAIKDQGAVKNLNQAKLHSICATKARVDTRWKKDAVQSENSTTNNAIKTTSTRPTRGCAAQPTSTVLTRANSLRQGITKTNAPGTTTNGVLRQKAVPNQTREIKTVTTKMVENKLQKAKIINKDKPIAVETQLRREDSNISRKSLNKLKEALAQEVKNVTAKTEKYAAVEIKVENDTNDEPIDSNAKTHDNAAVENDSKAQIKDGSIDSQADEIRNIDEGDNEMLILVSEYVNDIYEYLFQLESKHTIRENHLADQEEITPKMRAVLLDWINEVHCQFHLVAETYLMTVGIIDRYLQEVKDTRRSYLQLVGVTALFIAAKYEELYPPVIADFIYMTDKTYNQDQILEMEIQILRSLDFNLSRPVSIHFLRRFSKAADIQDSQHAMSKYFLELASIEYELASCKPSKIAAASLFLSLHMSQGDPKKASGFDNSYWNTTLEHYSHYTAEQLRPITRKIATIARNAPKAKLNSVYTKYQSSKLYKVSLGSVLYSPLMDSLIESKA